MVLRQAAHFYNTRGSQMIDSQKPLMLADALELEKARGASGPGGARSQGSRGSFQPPSAPASPADGEDGGAGSALGLRLDLPDPP